MHGEFDVGVVQVGGKEHLAMVKGEVSNAEDVRSECIPNA